MLDAIRMERVEAKLEALECYFTARDAIRMERVEAKSMKVIKKDGTLDAIRMAGMEDILNRIQF